MLSETTFYFSRVLGKKVYSDSNAAIGLLKDIVIDVESGKPQIVAFLLKSGSKSFIIRFSSFTISQTKGQYTFKCNNYNIVSNLKENTLFLKKHILDRQIVDINGRKLVRVNDMRIAIMSAGTFVVAVDVGLEGLLRRICGGIY